MKIKEIAKLNGLNEYEFEAFLMRCGAQFKGFFEDSVPDDKVEEYVNLFKAELVEKSRVKEEISVGHSSVGAKADIPVAAQEDINLEILKHLRNVDNDVHFIKNVVLAWVVLSIIAVLVYLIILL